MAVQTGKTNAKHIRVFMDDSAGAARDISADVSNISGVGLDYAEQDVTGYSDGIINFTLGHPSSEIEITGPISTTALTGAHVVFSGIVGLQQATAFTLTVEFGIRAAPVGGCPNFAGEYWCSQYKLNGDGTYSARLVPAFGTMPDFGTK